MYRSITRQIDSNAIAALEKDVRVARAVVLTMESSSFGLGSPVVRRAHTTRVCAAHGSNRPQERKPA